MTLSPLIWRFIILNIKRSKYSNLKNNVFAHRIDLVNCRKIYLGRPINCVSSKFDIDTSPLLKWHSLHEGRKKLLDKQSTCQLKNWMLYLFCSSAISYIIFNVLSEPNQNRISVLIRDLSKNQSEIPWYENFKQLMYVNLK